MLRKLNFTDRTRIPASAATFALRRESDWVLAFDASLDLSFIKSAPDARVYIEAQYRTSYMRFDCGAMSEYSIPSDRRLTQIDSERVVRFRVKVVDTSGGARRIVAASNDVVASCDRAGGGARVPLLPVNFDDLGDQVWRIHFEAEQPVLELNNRIEAIERLARHDAAFFALVYPAAVRQVLTNYVLIDRWQENDDGDDAAELWIRWGRELTGETLPADTEDRRAWIEDVIVAFCGVHRAADKMRSASEEAE